MGAAAYTGISDIGIRPIHGARCCAKHTTAMDGGSVDFAGSKNLPRMYLRRATAANTEFISGVVTMQNVSYIYDMHGCINRRTT